MLHIIVIVMQWNIYNLLQLMLGHIIQNSQTFKTVFHSCNVIVVFQVRVAVKLAVEIRCQIDLKLKYNEDVEQVVMGSTVSTLVEWPIILSNRFC